MNWKDHRSYIEMFPAAEFNFEECIVFLSRSNQEVLHQIRDGYLYKLIKVNQELILCKIGCTQACIQVEFPIGPPSKRIREEVASYVWEWFDLDKDLSHFYEGAMAIRGVGEWTADYVMMKCLHHPTAFPITDVGLHNALKIQLGLKRKPTLEEIKEFAANWEGLQAYAVFYLWRSLYEQTT